MTPTPNIGVSPTGALLSIARRHLSGWIMDVIEGLIVAFGLAEFIDGKFHKHLGKPQPLNPQHGVTYQSLIAVAPTSQVALVDGWVVRLTNVKRSQFMNALGTRAEESPGVVRPTSAEFRGALDTIRQIAQASNLNDEHGDEARTKKALELNMLHPDDNFITYAVQETPKQVAKIFGLVPKFFSVLHDELAAKLGYQPRSATNTSQPSLGTRILPTVKRTLGTLVKAIAVLSLTLVGSLFCAVHGYVIVAVVLFGIVTLLLAIPITIAREFGAHEAYRAMTALRMCAFVAIFIAYYAK